MKKEWRDEWPRGPYVHSDVFGIEGLRDCRDECSARPCTRDRDDSTEGIDFRLHGYGQRPNGDPDFQAIFEFATTTLLEQPLLEPRVLRGYGGH